MEIEYAHSKPTCDSPGTSKVRMDPLCSLSMSLIHRKLMEMSSENQSIRLISSPS